MSGLRSLNWWLDILRWLWYTATRKGSMADKLQIKTLRDKVQVVKNRYVRLEVTTRKGTEILVCPADFSELITELCSVGPYSLEKFRVFGPIRGQLLKLGLAKENAGNGLYYTPLLKRIQNKLIKAWEEQYYKEPSAKDAE
jgi:hypothetical protein